MIVLINLALTQKTYDRDFAVPWRGQRESEVLRSLRNADVAAVKHVKYSKQDKGYCRNGSCW